MARERPVQDEIYHIYNRGVEKRVVFLEDRDYVRFIHNLFEFNDTAPALNLYYKSQSYEVGLRKIAEEMRTKRNLLVELLAFCLMPNHYHLMLKSKTPNGVTEFMRKIGTGYTNYFNQKYERVGPLFQGKYKSTRIVEEAHFIHLPYYIHLNPLDLTAPEWRIGGVHNYNKAMKFLASYRWSSHLDYTGEKNFPSVTQRNLLLEFFEGTKQYTMGINEWCKRPKFDVIQDIILER